MPCPGQKPRTLRTLRRFFYFSISRFLGWLTFYLLRPPALACYAYILTHNFLPTPASARSLAQALRGSAVFWSPNHALSRPKAITFVAHTLLGLLPIYTLRFPLHMTLTHTHTSRPLSPCAFLPSELDGHLLCAEAQKTS